MKSILFILGTRPEAIKCAPIIRSFQNSPDCDVKICVTAQHRELLDQVLDFFHIVPDYDLNIMTPQQSLFDITTEGLKGIEPILSALQPDLVFVQGDTTTAFVGALAATYAKIPVAHIEAGLRSYNPLSPFPEETNRQLISRLANLHFAPTDQAVENLKQEHITQNVFSVGNSVIDALLMGLDRIQNDPETYQRYFESLGISLSNPILMVSCHRRENFGDPLERILKAISEISQRHPDVQIVFPVHLNPQVQPPVHTALRLNPAIFLIEPLTYPHLIYLMNVSQFILTDSGGIQEEAPTLGKPVLVLRDVTERTEGIDAGTAQLVGTDTETIVQAASTLFNSPDIYSKMSHAKNPYGDGLTAKRIVYHSRFFVEGSATIHQNG